MLELVVVHNGFDRFVRPHRSAPPRSVQAQLQNFQAYDAVPAGPVRLATPARRPVRLAAALAALGLLVLRRRDGLIPVAPLSPYGAFLVTYRGGLYVLGPPAWGFPSTTCRRWRRRSRRWPASVR